MWDMAKLQQMYDESITRFGVPPLSFALFDRRVLFPRSMVIEQIERETGQRVSLQALDGMATDGLFTWVGGAGPDGTDQGVPLYVPSRLGLLAKCASAGFGRGELRDFVDLEECVIDDCLADEDLPYDDDDCAVVARRDRIEIDQLNAEMWSRLPEVEHPKDWHRSSWNSELARLGTQELVERRERIETHLRRVEQTDLATAPQKWRRHLGRTAFCIRARDESIRALLIAAERAQLEAGFSPAVQFSGNQSVAPDSSVLEEFGVVDWPQTFRAWRFLDDPDHVALRVPGFVLVGGRITLTELLTGEEYGRRRELFRLDEYLEHFKEVAAGPRCSHCGKLLARSASSRRLYCSDECSQASRQKSYRRRQKATILRRGAR